MLQVHPCRRSPFASGDYSLHCNHDAQGHVCSNSMWGSNTDGTFGRGGAQAHKYKYKSTHWSHWSERVSLGKQSLHPTCSAHCVWLTHWKPVEYIAMLSHIGIQYNTLSVHNVLMLCHIRRPPQVETKVDRGRERDTCSFGFPGSRCIETVH